MSIEPSWFRRTSDLMLIASLSHGRLHRLRLASNHSAWICSLTSPAQAQQSSELCRHVIATQRSALIEHMQNVRSFIQFSFSLGGLSEMLWSCSHSRSRRSQFPSNLGTSSLGLERQLSRTGAAVLPRPRLLSLW